MPNKEPRMVAMTITPEIATKYVSDINIRRLNNRVVEEYADDMKNGRWEFGSSVIHISSEGKLINGQHRMWACITSGCDFKTWVCFDVKKEAENTIDIGYTRRVADIVKVDQATEVSTLAKCILATKIGDQNLGIWSFLNGRIRSSGKTNIQVSKTAQIAETKEHGDEYLEYVRSGQRMRMVFRKGSSATYGYFIWLAKWLGKDDRIDEYVEEFCDKSNSEYPVRAPSNARQAIYDRICKPNIKLTREWILAVLLYSYDKFLEEKTVKSFSKAENALDSWSKLIKEKKKEVDHADD